MIAADDPSAARRLARSVRSRLRRLRGEPPTSAEVTAANTRAAYERLYRSKPLMRQYLNSERVQFFGEVADVAAAFAPRTVLDVGCGSGHLLHALSQRVPLDAVVGVDHAAPGLRLARRLLPSATFVAADLYDLDLARTFDLVLCTEVLEHVDQPDRVVEVLRRHCTSGGTVVVTVPDGAVDTFEGHVNFWSESALRAFLGPYGLRRLQRLDGGDLLAVLAADD